MCITPSERCRFLSRHARPAGLTAVGQLVRRRVPEAVFLESIGQEITFVLPYSGARDGTFAQLFRDLDLAMPDLGLTSYGISDTTLEEVRRAPALRSRPSSLRGRPVSESKIPLPALADGTFFKTGNSKPAAR